MRMSFSFSKPFCTLFNEKKKREGISRTDSLYNSTMKTTILPKQVDKNYTDPWGILRERVKTIQS